MSENEIFYGKFKESDYTIEPSDTDEFYDWETENKIHLVKVEGKLYEFCEIEKLDQYGFSVVIPPMDDYRYTRFICLWYNGGGGLHEVVASLIKESLNG